MLKASSRNFAAIAAWTDYLINDHQVARSVAPLSARLSQSKADSSKHHLVGTWL
jgi:hypothetical protein